MGTTKSMVKTSKKILSAHIKVKANLYDRRIKKLNSEIEILIASLYNTNARDSQIKYENLKTYRIEIIRGFIVYIQLAIDELLRDFIVDFIKHQTKMFIARKVKKIVEEMRSAEVVEWCARLNLITKKQYEFLKDLNRIRNACAHNWVLDIPKYKRTASKKLKRWIKTPVVRYNNKNLFNVKVFKKGFLPIYSQIYLRLLSKDWKMKGFLK